MPQSQVSGSFEYPHFIMFTLDRPTCVRNRLSAFQVVQGFSAPAERRSSALMLRCTLAPRGSSRYFHNSMPAAFAVVLMGSVHLRKLFRDFRRRCPLSGCLWSIVCRVRSVQLAMMSGIVWWGDTGGYGQTVGVCLLQTACDHSTGIVQCHVQFLCMGGLFPHWASVLCN